MKLQVASEKYQQKQQMTGTILKIVKMEKLTLQLGIQPDKFDQIWITFINSM